MIKLTLVPRKVGKNFERVELHIFDEPISIISIEEFYAHLGDNDLRSKIYFSLLSGETVTVNLVEVE